MDHDHSWLKLGSASIIPRGTVQLERCPLKNHLHDSFQSQSSLPAALVMLSHPFHKDTSNYWAL